MLGQAPQCGYKVEKRGNKTFEKRFKNTLPNKENHNKGVNISFFMFNFVMLQWLIITDIGSKQMALAHYK